MAEYRITDKSESHDYRVEIPNIINEIGLTVYEYTLYAHLKRAAGDEGDCFRSTQTLAKECKMSTASVCRAKKRLHEMGLIKVELAKGEHGGKDWHNITITNIWKENYAFFKENKKQVTVGKLASYCGSIKEEPFKKNPIRKQEKPLKKRFCKKFCKTRETAIHATTHRY